MTAKPERKSATRAGRSGKDKNHDPDLNTAKPPKLERNVARHPEAQAGPAYKGQGGIIAHEATATNTQTGFQVAESLPQSAVATLEVVGPLTSRAVFWQPRHSAESGSLPHVPFLFWLMETVRPARIVQLGLNDTVGFMALCQAADRLGLEAVCTGIDLSPGNDALTGPLAEQHATLYGDFSFVVADDFVRATRHVQNGQIDFLVVDTALSDEQVMALRAHWMPLLSDRAVLIIPAPETCLAGAEARQYVDSLMRARPTIRFPQTSPGLEVVLLGGQQPERLLRMAELELGMPGYLGAWQVFTRLGQGLKSEQLSKSRLESINVTSTRVKELETSLNALKADLAQESKARQAALDSEAGQLAVVAGLQAQIFDLQVSLEMAQASEEQTAEIETLKTIVSAEAEKRKSHWRKVESLTAEKAALDTELAETRALLEKAATEKTAEIRTLEATVSAEAEKRKSHWRKVESLTAEKTALDTELAETRALLEKAAAEKAAEIETLKAAVEAEAEKRTSHWRKVENLTAEKAALDTELAETRALLEKAATEKTAEIESLTAEKAAEIETLKAAVEAEAEKRKSHWRKVENLTAEKAALDTELAETRALLEKAAAEKAALDEAQQTHDEAIAVHAAALQDLQAQHDAAARERQEAAAQLQALEQANARLQEQVKQMLDKRLTTWEAHEALKVAHAALLAQLEADNTPPPA